MAGTEKEREAVSDPLPSEEADMVSSGRESQLLFQRLSVRRKIMTCMKSAPFSGGIRGTESTDGNGASSTVA